VSTNKNFVASIDFAEPSRRGLPVERIGLKLCTRVRHADASLASVRPSLLRTAGGAWRPIDILM